MTDLKQQITLRPTFSYLFSYAWLAGELILFVSLIQFFFNDLSSLLISGFMLVFARLYYWLNFSPETGTQTLFILGIIPLVWFITIFNLEAYNLAGIISYIGVFVTFGAIRLALLRYQITSTSVTINLFGTRTFKIDKTERHYMIQHSRGKALNFGCIIIPIERSNKGEVRSKLSSILFNQKNRLGMTDMVRLDGLANPEVILEDLKQKITNE